MPLRASPLGYDTIKSFADAGEKESGVAAVAMPASASVVKDWNNIILLGASRQN